MNVETGMRFSNYVAEQPMIAWVSISIVVILCLLDALRIYYRCKCILNATDSVSNNEGVYRLWYASHISLLSKLLVLLKLKNKKMETYMLKIFLKEKGDEYFKPKGFDYFALMWLSMVGMFVWLHSLYLMTLLYAFDSWPITIVINIIYILMLDLCLRYVIPRLIVNKKVTGRWYQGVEMNTIRYTRESH